MLNRKVIEPYIKTIAPIPTNLEASFRPKDKVLCILFDIYGTLFISEGGDIGLLHSSLKKRHQIQELLDEYDIGLTTESLLNSLTSKINEAHLVAKSNGVDYPEVEIISIWNSIINKSGELVESTIRDFAIRFELMINPVYPMPGLKECLDWCRKSQKVMGIISNAQFYTPLLFDWFLDKKMEQLGFLDELTLLSFKNGFAKPSPILFTRAGKTLKKQGIQSHHVVYLGNDMLKDIFPAKRAGFQTALFAGDARSLRLREDDPNCKCIKADMVITDLRQITTW